MGSKNLNFLNHRGQMLQDLKGGNVKRQQIGQGTANGDSGTFIRLYTVETKAQASKVWNCKIWPLKYKLF